MSSGAKGWSAPRDTGVPVGLFAIEGLMVDRTGKSRRKISTALLSVVSNSALVCLKVVVGSLMGSVAVISEGIHSGLDLIAAVIALVAVRASSREPDEQHPYGHGKVENVSGTIEALLIFAAAIWIIYEAIRKLIEPEAIEFPVWGAGVMLVSVLVNILVSRRLFKVGRETDSVALQADAWHLRTDVYTSAGVLLGLLVIWIVGLTSPGVDLRWLDPAVALVVALMILRAAWNLTRDSARDLLDSRLPDEDVAWIADFVQGRWPAVRSFHHLRTRKAGSNRFVDFHIVVEDEMSVADSHSLSDEIVAAIKDRLPESRVHIHVEPCDYACKTSCEDGCSVDPAERKGRGRGKERT